MSVETLAVVLTGLGVVAALFTAIGTFSHGLRKQMQSVHESLRTEMQAGHASLRKEIDGLRLDMNAKLRSVNSRIDTTNMRIDRLTDALRVTSGT